MRAAAVAGPHAVAAVAPVQLHQVSRQYGTGEARVQALDDVSVTFPPGSWSAVMGPSGSGKSTLLHCAAGLDRVTTGHVHLAGRGITHATDAVLTGLRRRSVGFVFQNALLGLLTVASLAVTAGAGALTALAATKPSPTTLVAP